MENCKKTKVVFEIRKLIDLDKAFYIVFQEEKKDNFAEANEPRFYYNNYDKFVRTDAKKWKFEKDFEINGNLPLVFNFVVFLDDSLNPILHESIGQSTILNFYQDCLEDYYEVQVSPNLISQKSTLKKCDFVFTL